MAKRVPFRLPARLCGGGACARWSAPFALAQTLDTKWAKCRLLIAVNFFQIVNVVNESKSSARCMC